MTTRRSILNTPDPSPLSLAAAAGLRSLIYRTPLGTSLVGSSEELLRGKLGSGLRGKVQLVFTSPPFPLNRKKRYGNLQGEEFKHWLAGYALILKDLLAPKGAIVMEMGNAWEAGEPVMSTLALESLLEFKKLGGFHLCQEFVWHNPARLPSPAEWVTVRRIRVKDSFTRFWWLSHTPFPKADNRRVLVPYSSSMKALLKRGKYNAGMRPSEHRIGDKSFLKRHKGVIPPSVISMNGGEADSVITLPNTESNPAYKRFCEHLGVTPHPARMPKGLVEFFLKLCTDEGDLVLDPFGGSNTTGSVAEGLGRRWLSIEVREDYAKAGVIRFLGNSGLRGAHGYQTLVRKVASFNGNFAEIR